MASCPYRLASSPKYLPEQRAAQAPALAEMEKSLAPRLVQDQRDSFVRRCLKAVGLVGGR